jgi:hypothetical protein
VPRQRPWAAASRLAVLLCLCVAAAACAPRYPEPPSDAYYLALHEHRLRFTKEPPRIQRLSDDTREMEAILRRAQLRRSPEEHRFYVRHMRVEEFWALEARKARARAKVVSRQAARNRFLEELEARAAQGLAQQEARRAAVEQARQAPRPTLDELLRDRQP